jgi:hypothetical protein
MISLRTARRTLLRGGLLALYLLIGLAIGGRYVAPGALPADSGELQLVARELGVAHPPGYPLYTVAAHAFGRAIVPNTGLGARIGFALEPLLGGPCPRLAEAERNAGPTEDVYGIPTCIEDPVGGWWSWSTNFFSLVLALLTLWVVFRAGRRLGDSWTTGLLASATLLAMPVFVQQATTANIRMPTALLTAIVIALALRWLDATHEGEPPPRRARGILSWTGDGRLHGLALALGLAASHHVSLVFLAPIVVCVLVVRRPWLLAPRQLQPLVFAGALGLLPLLYLPVRAAAGALLAPPDLGTLGGFWNHVTGANFRGDLRPFDDPLALWDRTRVVLDLFVLQIGWPGVLLVIVGALWLLSRRRSTAWLLLGVILTFAVLAVVYRAPQTVEYLMPAHVAIALLAAAAGSAIMGFREQALVSSPPLRRAGVIALALAIGVQSIATARDVRTTHPQMDAIVRATTFPSDCATPVLASWHYATPLWLGRFTGEDVGRSFPNSETHYVHPEGAEPIGETWRRRAEAMTREAGAVILTNLSGEILEADTALWPVADTPFWSTAPDACGARAQRAATLAEMPPRLRGISLGLLPINEEHLVWPPEAAPRFTSPPGGGPTGRVRFVAAERPDAASLAAATRHEITLEFETLAPLNGRVTVVVQLIDPATGAVHGQVDRGFSAPRWNDPRGLAMRAELHRFRGPRPERLELHVGLYHVTEDGRVQRWEVTGPTAGGKASLSSGATVLTPFADETPAVVIQTTERAVGPADAPGTDGRPGVVVDPRQPSAAAQRADRPLSPAPPDAIPFGDAMSLLASKVSRRDAALTVDLTWLAQRAYRSDYTISVQATAEGGYFAQSDGTPAVGAYPTLKWLPGQQVRDRHRLTLPADWPTDVPTRVSVGVYDAFSLEPLPVTDGERVRAGQGQRATLLEAVLP